MPGGEVVLPGEVARRWVEAVLSSGVDWEIARRWIEAVLSGGVLSGGESGMPEVSGRQEVVRAFLKRRSITVKILS